MNFNEYQHAALQTADYPEKGRNLLYPALEIGGEVGEIIDKIKKYYRNFGITSNEQLNDEQRHALILEGGDALWGLATLATELGVPFECFATYNVEKLADRKRRNVVKSEGDNR